MTRVRHHMGPLSKMGDPFRLWPFILVLAACLADVPLRAQDVEEEDDDPAWSASVSLRAQSRLAQYGIDAAPEQLTLLTGGGASHRSGFEFGLSAAMQPGSGTFERLILSSGYEWELSEPWTLGISLEHAWYRAGSLNPLASSPTSGAFSVEYDGEVWSYGLGYDRYFGGEGGTYVSLDASAIVAMEGISFLPLALVTFGSQTVTTTTLKRNKGKSFPGSPASATVTGLSSVDLMMVTLVRLGEGWSLSVMPGVSYTPSDLAASTTRLTWSVGMRKSL